jgi:hypothetical protein
LYIAEPPKPPKLGGETNLKHNGGALGGVVDGVGVIVGVVVAVGVGANILHAVVAE